MAAAVERGPAERLQFLDAVRGFALLLMIVNHTGRWWQDGAMGWPRYNLIYGSMVVGAPLFLFLVGFCLPLSFARRPDAGRAGVVTKFLSRGIRLVLASWLLNFLIFRDEPFWEGGVLQTIGLGIILSLPPMLALHRRYRHLSGPPRPLRVDYALVRRVDHSIELSVRREDLDVAPLEAWARDKVVGRIPGAGHEA